MLPKFTAARTPYSVTNSSMVWHSTLKLTLISNRRTYSRRNKSLANMRVYYLYYYYVLWGKRADSKADYAQQQIHKITLVTAIMNSEKVS